MAAYNKLDLTGQKFGKLIVLTECINNTRYIKWNCLCECGNSTISSTQQLRNGKKTHCGCSKKTTKGIPKTHGYKINNKAKSEYSIWMSMKARCYNKNSQAFKHYGGRGIKVCRRWKNSFQNFIEDMGNRPSEKHSIDRINNDGNYEKRNCRWVTYNVQAKNKRSNTLIKYKGECKILSDWARDLDMYCGNLAQALKHKSFSEIIESRKRVNKIKEYKDLLLANKWYWKNSPNRRELRKSELGKKITKFKKECDPKNGVYFRFVSKQLKNKK